MPDEIPTAVLGGRFVLGEPIAEGGVAVVLRAIDRERSEPAAVKLQHALYAGVPSVERRLRREAALLERLGGRREFLGARVRQSGLWEQRHWLAIDLVPGDTLRHRLRGGPIPPSEAVLIAHGLLSRLAVLHAEGVVHRDLKPANILLSSFASPAEATPAERSASVLLIDLDAALPFGVRPRDVDPDLAPGAPAYAAPEQWDDAHPASPVEDLYSAGLLLFQLLAGLRPYGRVADHLAEVTDRARVPVPSVRATCPSLSPEIDDVVRMAMAPDPEDRFATAQAMRAALVHSPEFLAAVGASATGGPP